MELIYFLTECLIVAMSIVIIVTWILEVREKKQKEIRNNYSGNGDYYRPPVKRL